MFDGYIPPPQKKNRTRLDSLGTLPEAAVHAPFLVDLRKTAQERDGGYHGGKNIANHGCTKIENDMTVSK